MSLTKNSVLCILMVLLFAACGSAPSGGGASGSSASDAQALAQAALDRMDGKEPSGSSQNKPAQNSPSSQQAQQSQQGPVVNTSSRKPAWVDSVDSVYKKNQYVAAVGYSSDRATAERNSLANLVAYFGQSIKADQTSTNRYREAVQNGATTGWSSSYEQESVIKTAASMDTLVGAEIKEVWYDSKSVYYAVAAMEKSKTAQMYLEMIKANQNMIDNLINIPAGQKNTIEGYMRYQFAGTVADINVSYVNLLRLIDATPPAQKPGNDYRLEAQEIVKTIPISITVKNDKAGSIQGAFAKCLNELGFRSGGTNSRYVLQVDVTVSPVDLPGNKNKFARIEISANFMDSSVKSVLLPFNYNTREGHLTETEAVNIAYRKAGEYIEAEYKGVLSNYLSQILPKN